MATLAGLEGRVPLEKLGWDVRVPQDSPLATHRGCTSPDLCLAPGMLSQEVQDPSPAPRSPAQGCHCPQAGAGSQPGLWGWLSLCGTALASFLVLPALVLPVPHCLGVASRAAWVLAPAGELGGCAQSPGSSWKLHHLDLFSSERYFHTHGVLITLFIWHRGASSCSLPHATAPFPTLGGLEHGPAPASPPSPSGKQPGERRAEDAAPDSVLGGASDRGHVSCPQWTWVREEQ